MSQPLRCEDCEHPRPDRHHIRCKTHIWDLHQTIAERAPQLDIRPGKSSRDDGGRPPGFESTPPINLHIRAQLDPESKPFPLGPDDVDRPPLSVDRTLGYWWALAIKARGDLGDLDWLVHQPWVENYVRDLRTLAAQLRAATGDPPPKPVARCLRVLGLGDRELLYCGEDLFMPPTEPRGDDEPIRPNEMPEIRCPNPRCGHTYTGVELLRLKLANEQPPARPATNHSAREGSWLRPAAGDHDWRWPSFEVEEAR
jgi:hypothetical protein